MSDSINVHVEYGEEEDLGLSPKSSPPTVRERTISQSSFSANHHAIHNGDEDMPNSHSNPNTDEDMQDVPEPVTGASLQSTYVATPASMNNLSAILASFKQPVGDRPVDDKSEHGREVLRQREKNKTYVDHQTIHDM